MFVILFFAVSAEMFLGAENIEKTDFLYWRQLGQKRAQDGGVTADFELRGGEGAETIELYYSALPFKSSQTGKFETSPAEVFYRKLEPDTRTLQLYSSRFALAELWAKATFNGRVFVAQTRINLYGESENRGETDFTRLDVLPALPSVEVYRSQYVANPDAESIEQEGVDKNHAYLYSIMQAGETALIRLVSSGKPETLRIYEGDAFSGTVNSSNGVFTYTFPDYPELADASLFAWKDVCLVFDTPDEVISCTIPVYRSLYGRMNLPAGLILLAGVIAASAGLVIFKGRRFAV
ncbi:MAG: hypothetical protein LBG90_03780 [Spirochaetaceae bacterium]|nr:hypothetical protein [Spirochaetaceae bacterium]